MYRNLVNNLLIFHCFSFLKVGDVKIANFYLLSTDFINLIIEAIICTYSLILHYINTYRFFAQNIKISTVLNTYRFFAQNIKISTVLSFIQDSILTPHKFTFFL